MREIPNRSASSRSDGMRSPCDMPVSSMRLRKSRCTRQGRPGAMILTDERWDGHLVYTDSRTRVEIAPIFQK